MVLLRIGSSNFSVNLQKKNGVATNELGKMEINKKKN